MGARTEAMRALNRALALDPRNQDAVGVPGELLLRPPRELPPEARAEMAEDVASERREMARIGAVSYASWIALAPLLVFAGVRDWVSYLLSCSIVAGSALVCRSMHRRGRISDASAFSLLVATTAAIAILSRYLGPFMVAPALIATNT